MMVLAGRDSDAQQGRRVVRDTEYSWSNSAMMNLYSGTTDPFSHRCRIVLYEKGMDFQVVDVDLFNKPEDIAIINPYNRVPVLVDRDLILYESNIINEYIDERFPHPQLMPPDPIMRAKARQILHTLENELFSHIEALEKNQKAAADKARIHVRDQLMQLVPLFAKQKYMLGDEFSMLDVAIAPLLWRLEHYNIELPKTAAPLMKYAERIFTRQGFIDALTPSERAMRR
jgi:RNA polymerase-associated protein